MKKKVISIVILLFGIILYAVSLYIKNVFGNAQFEQLIYSFRFATGTSGNVILNGIKYCLPIVIGLSIILFIPIFFKPKKRIYLSIKLKKFQKQIHVRIFPICSKLIYSIILSILFIVYSLYSIGLFAYLKNQAELSTLYETYYVDPNTVKIEFPEKKRNLITIYLESMESTFSSLVINGEQTNLIPNLTNLAKEHTSFSETASLGGANKVYGTTWTMAGILAQTSGIGLRYSVDGTKFKFDQGFLPGVITIGDILKKEGYNQTFMIGSSAYFANRNIFFTTHGEYDIKDLYWARETGHVDDKYWVWWRYEDKKLYDFAKEELLSLSSKEEPFNFTMLTVDTHTVDGYLDASCSTEYDDQYFNVISCADKMVSEFITWIQKQDFYDNTTIVITGDHLSMQSSLLDYFKSDERRIYNTFIHSAVEPVDNRFRTFTSFDIFPTTLASLGVSIEGNKLGLGTNLFSTQKTLAEEKGIDYINEEIVKNSEYYNLNFWREAYYDLMTDESKK